MQTLEALFLEQEPSILRYLRKMVRDPHLAEDLTQETFLRAIRFYRSRGVFPPEPRPWFLRIARNLAIDECRRSSPAYVQDEFLRDSASAAPAEDDHEIAFEAFTVSGKRIAEEVGRAIEDLPRSCRELMIARYRKGLSCWELAMRNGISVTSAKVRLHRGRRKLKELIQNRFQTDFERRKPCV